MNDPIVEVVRRIRAKIAAEHGNDLHRIFEDARRRQGVKGRPVVSFDVSPERESSIVRETPPVLKPPKV